jgi:hypothetical protein
MAALPIVDADAPTFDHGDTEDKPNPAPNASRMSDSAAAHHRAPHHGRPGHTGRVCLIPD